nr:gB/pp65/pp150 fusion protein [synthetic construct]
MAFMGDVLGLASCVTINQTSVKVLRDMNVKESPGRCYSRPVVIFNFANSSYVQYGQLGEDNEILLGNHRTEECQLPSLKIFIAGNSAYEYVDYLFKRMIDLSSISTVDARNLVPMVATVQGQNLKYQEFFWWPRERAWALRQYDPVAALFFFDIDLSTSHATSSTHNGSHTSRTTSAQTRSVYSQHVTSSEAVSHRANETIYNTTLKYGDVVGVNTHHHHHHKDEL